MQKKFSQKFELIEIILLCTICDFFGENIFTNYGETERDPLKLLLKSSPNFVTNLSPLTLGLLYVCTRSLGALRAPTSRLRPFGPSLGPSGLLDNVLHALRALRPCDPRNSAMTTD